MLLILRILSIHNQNSDLKKYLFSFDFLPMQKLKVYQVNIDAELFIIECVVDGNTLMAEMDDMKQ